MVGRAEILFRCATVVVDKPLCLDVVIVEELLHGIVVVHGYDIVFCIVEEHDVEVAAGCPAAGEGILAEGLFEAQRQGTVDVEDGCCAEVARLLGLDEFLVESLALVLLTFSPLFLIMRTHVLDEQVDQMLQDEGMTDGMANLVGK